MAPKSKSRVFIEWSIPKDTADQRAQDELSEVMIAPEGIYHIAYTEKVPSINPDVKKIWIQRLSEAKVEGQ